MNTSVVRWRAAIASFAVAVVAVGCASGGSDGVGESTPTVGSVVPVTVVPVTEVPVSTVPDPVEQPPDTSVDVAAGKNVVTRSAEVEDGVDGVLPEGVDAVMARVTSADGDVCEVCLWLADDDTSRQRGLMGVTDLGDAVGMAFRWDEPRTGNFFMFQTPTPLSIAWFGVGGAHVGQADMEPCMVDDSVTCERYGADAAYTLAVEMFGGQLGAVGIGPGSSVELLDLPCSSIPS